MLFILYLSFRCNIKFKSRVGNDEGRFTNAAVNTSWAGIFLTLCSCCNFNHAFHQFSLLRWYSSPACSSEFLFYRLQLDQNAIDFLFLYLVYQTFHLDPGGEYGDRPAPHPCHHVSAATQQKILSLQQVKVSLHLLHQRSYGHSLQEQRESVNLSPYFNDLQHNCISLFPQPKSLPAHAYQKLVICFCANSFWLVWHFYIYSCAFIFKVCYTT